MKKRESGFTLIELLIVIAIIGILAAIAIPNLLNAVQRGKQKRTMSDMRALATAVEAYAVDNNVYPAATCNAGLFTNGTDARADDGLVHEPDADLHRAAPEDRRLGPLHVLRAATRRRTTTASAPTGATTRRATLNCGTTTNFNDDIIYSDGTFIQWPEGTQF